MEIPYTVTARKDTGLFNSKVGIWLFLASEVMLFGGLFSGYVFLRIYADYPWPERALPVVPGLINTFVLIGSSVTVVFAWASLKMRQWRRFQFFMAITVACAGIFMVLKGIEYNAKWGHQAVRMDDFTIVEGHTHYSTILTDGHVGHFHTKDEAKEAAKEDAKKHGGDDEKHAKKEPRVFKANTIIFKPTSVEFSLARAYESWVDSMVEQAADQKSEFVSQAEVFLYGHIEDYSGTDKEPKSTAAREAEEKDIVKDYATADKKAYKVGKNSLYLPAGTPLSYSLLKRAQKIYLAGRAHNAEIRTAILKANWRKVKEKHSDSPYWEQAPHAAINKETQLDEQVDENDKVISGSKVIDEVSKLTFEMTVPKPLVIKRSWVRRPLEADAKAELKDDTKISGELLDSPIAMSVDAVDFRWMAQKAVEAKKDPMAVIEKSWIFSDKNKHSGTYLNLWRTHKQRIALLEEELLNKYGKDKDGKPKRVATETERYRMTWQDLVHYARAEHEKEAPGDEEFAKHRPKFFEGFAGPNHKSKDAKNLHAFPELEIPHTKVALSSMFTPKWNTYYAIYFTLTGLHGLHVIGGAIVLSYYLFCSKGLYRRNPEWLANRVEVGGLFWHFVDLVWIFLFPILYLM